MSAQDSTPRPEDRGFRLRLVSIHDFASRSGLSLLLRLCGSTLILVALFYFLPVEVVWASLRRIQPGRWLLVLGRYLVVYQAAAIKWRLMLNLGGANLSFAQGTRCYFAGLFGTLFLPSVAGGDVVRVGLALRLVRRRAAVVLGALLDRMLDAAALVLVATSGAILLPRALPAESSLLLRDAFPIASEGTWCACVRWRGRCCVGRSTCY